VMSDYDRMCADHPYRTDETESPDAVPDVVHDLTNWAAGQLAERPTRRELKDMVSVVLADRIQWRNAVLQASQARDVWMRKVHGVEEECQRLVRLVEASAQGNRRLTRERDAALSLVKAVAVAVAVAGDPPLARLRTHLLAAADLLAAAEALDEAEGGGVG
jgi:hypothetical protein